ncbi:ABC transporter ATP-binding protein [Roseiarcus sp.]|uniref:ABC transporter ATP-binding protein n=1 Tax=Roseiarcus sp. TaxID=1969460 RepID=UPI003F9EB54B
MNAHPARGPSLETIGMSKSFGALRALQDVSISVPAGSFHALLGENGAGKSTLVKCIMGFYTPDRGQLLIDGAEVAVRNPREAQALGVGMVYQHFTLVPALTAAENLVVSRADAPSFIDWRKERKALEAFLDRMPFRVPLDRPVSGLAAGEKQKLEILKLLYLDQRFLILDEPTSVLTPGEADEILGLLRDMAHRGEITVAMISHKFREVEAFCDDFTVLRRGQRVGGGKVGAVSTREMAAMMIGDAVVRPSAARVKAPTDGVMLEVAGLFAENDEGRDAVNGFDIKVKAGEIVGIAGISGNGQSELVEALSGQRRIKLGQVLIRDQDFEPTRDHFDRFKVFGLPEEPLKNASVPNMSVAENMAFRKFDKAPMARLGFWLSREPIRAEARELIERYNVRTPSPDTPIRDLSGGNVQRAVLARELSGDVDVLIVANPCFGLDFASVADIRSQIMEQRNRGAAVLLVSEDLDEILELSDRIAVMSGGKVAYLTDGANADRTTIGRHMAGH